MSQETKRLYKGKDVDMITSLSTILTNARANQSDLQKKRTNLTSEYFDDIEKRLNDIVKKYFGLDNAGQLRRQTIVVYSIQDTAYKAVSEMKSQVQSSYNTDKVKQIEVLNGLGYNVYFKAAGNDDTEALINLLYQYQQNMTPDVQQDLVKAGTPLDSITAVLTFADTLKAANISQESFKGTKKTITAEAVATYNGIHQEVIGKISKLARIFFPGNLPKQQLLSYNAILKALNKQPSKPTEAPASGS